jgi:hypothetical protein
MHFGAGKKKSAEKLFGRFAAPERGNPLPVIHKSCG